MTVQNERNANGNAIPIAGVALIAAAFIAAFGPWGTAVSIWWALGLAYAGVLLHCVDVFKRSPRYPYAWVTCMLAFGHLGVVLYWSVVIAPGKSSRRD